jgi:hypothetical protein
MILAGELYNGLGSYLYSLCHYLKLSRGGGRSGAAPGLDVDLPARALLGPCGQSHAIGEALVVKREDIRRLPQHHP